MNIGYIDTSFLLSIIFEDKNYETSVKYWNELDILYSSLLLEVESRINVYKYCVLTKKNKILYKEKEDQLKDLLENVDKKNIDKEIVLEIKNIDKLKRPKSLDSIHLATANIVNKLLDEELLLYTYDKNMIEIGKEMGMETI